jgi:hypothetical protein
MTARCFSCIRTGPIGAHPLLGLVPETPPRGAGAQFYLFGIDPDAAAARAEARGTW